MIDLSKQQALNANPKSIQQINFTGRLKQAENTKIFYSWRSKENLLWFLQEAVRVLYIYLVFI